MSLRHHTATDKSEPKHTSMICTTFGMWFIGVAQPHPHPQGFTYPPHGQQGITRLVVPLLHVVSWPCLASPTHSRIYLFPHKQQGMTRHIVPLLHVIFWPYGQQPHPHTQGFTRVMQSKSLQLGLLSRRQGNHTSQRQGNHTSQRHCHKDRVITNIIAQGQTHMKSSQVKCIQMRSLLPSSFIIYFNNQISTIFSRSSKLFLVKIFRINFPK